LIRTKRTKIVATGHVSRLKIYLNHDCGRRSALDPAGGVYSAPPDSLAGFSRAASPRRRQGRVKRAGRKGEKGWEDEKG